MNIEVSIAKLYKIYNTSVNQELKVLKSMFQRIFCCEYNIGFKTPATYVCSYCQKRNEQIKSTNDKKKKVELLLEKRIHKKRANAFYELLRQCSVKV